MNTKKTVDALNSLIIINNDRIEGYKTVLENIHDADLQLFFLDLIETSVKCRRELIIEVEKLGGDSEKAIGTSNNFFRAWLEVEEALSRNDKKAILNSCEYGEDVVLETYKNVLIQEVNEINSVEQKLLNDQYALLKTDHIEVKRMRNTFKRIRIIS